ncbi:glycosyltransferase [Sporosarcina sp. ACRSM]|uniref:glycosyltransferase n=1 Tax=Sporosarcina sp. ACRSM TaxID=2918216 RepID=UPI001EF59A93|nr:glycosyltransferase family 2 protein [Sporosarcina sp. ACRSM]MCG7334344.1 glycosyltransferase [Sporosarcina sp. ACRSM]
MKPILSICMIVKNEEKVLSRCLDSISGIADEIIIVDTGSNDQSKEIALRYTNNVYDFEWVDDFSKARNYAASKATGEWIFAIDADEFVERESFQKLKVELVEKPPKFNIIGVQIVSFVGQNGENTSLNYHERLYKNNGDISYYRNVHEILAHVDSKENKGTIDFQLFHSGYLADVMNEKNKFERNLNLLLNKKEKEPMDYFFIGNEYRNLEELDKAITYYQKAYTLKPDMYLDWVKKLLLYLAETLHRSKRDEEALEILESCEKIYPNLVDFKFYKGAIYFDKKQYKRSKKIFEDILLQKGNLVSDTSIDFLELSPLRYLGEIYEKENELHKAVQSYSKALSLNESDDKLWIKLITLLGKYSSLKDLSDFLNNNMVNKTTMNPVRISKILLSVPIINVQKLSRSFLDNPALTTSENEALLMKNLQLDECSEEVIDTLIKKNPQEIVSLLATGIFSIVDFILLTLNTKNSVFEEFLYKIKYDQPLENLYNMLFKKKNKKLTILEENFFVSVFKQAVVLDSKEVLSVMNGRKSFLSKETRNKLNKI